MKPIILVNYLATYDKIKTKIGSHECARLVQAIQNAETGNSVLVGKYKGNVKVRDSTTIVTGTVVATLLNGVYPNESTGNHVAIFVRKVDGGFVVFDQSKKKPPGERMIHYRGGKNPRHDVKKKDGTIEKNVLDMSNDGDFFYIVEV